MKGRVIVGAACLLASLLLGFAGRCVISDTAETLTRYLGEAMEASGDAQLQKVRECAVFWEKRKDLLGVFVHHDRTEAMDEGFAVLSECMKTGDAQGLAESMRKLKAMARTLSSEDSPSWRNLLRTGTVTQ